MSKPTARQKGGSHKKRPADLGSKPASDKTIYIGLLVIGAFAVLLVSLVTGGDWEAPAIGYVIALAFLTNLYAFKAYQGKAMANWKQALARIPLRFVGYGSKDGKPLTAAHNHDSAKLAILVCIAVCVVIIVGLSFWLIQE